MRRCSSSGSGRSRPPSGARAVPSCLESEGGTVEELRPTEDATHREPRRFERRAASLATAPVAAEPERRTITITGQPTPARRRRPLMDAPMAQPDRIALWAFLLGLLLVAVAAGTAHA